MTKLSTLLVLTLLIVLLNGRYTSGAIQLVKSLNPYEEIGSDVLGLDTSTYVSLSEEETNAICQLCQCTLTGEDETGREIPDSTSSTRMNESSGKKNHLRKSKLSRRTTNLKKSKSGQEELAAAHAAVDYCAQRDENFLDKLNSDNVELMGQIASLTFSAGELLCEAPGAKAAFGIMAKCTSMSTPYLAKACGIAVSKWEATSDVVCIKSAETVLMQALEDLKGTTPDNFEVSMVSFSEKIVNSLAYILSYLRKVADKQESEATAEIFKGGKSALGTLAKHASTVALADAFFASLKSKAGEVGVNVAEKASATIETVIKDPYSKEHLIGGDAPGYI